MDFKILRELHHVSLRGGSRESLAPLPAHPGGQRRLMVKTPFPTSYIANIWSKEDGQPRAHTLAIFYLATFPRTPQSRITPGAVACSEGTMKNEKSRQQTRRKFLEQTGIAAGVLVAGLAELNGCTSSEAARVRRLPVVIEAWHWPWIHEIPSWPSGALAVGR